jgi:3-dehydroquinate synthase
LETFKLNFEDISIPFVCGEKIFPTILPLLKKHIKSKIIIVTDDTVKNLHLNSVVSTFEKSWSYKVLSSPAGESYKTLSSLANYIDLALRWGADRFTIILALGGGIPGNVGGCLAGLLFRGVPFIHVPTTLISLADSVISLKQAVNSNVSKNTIGLYYTPKLIVGDISFLETLPNREIKSGICEFIKNTLAIAPHDLVWLKDSLLPNFRSSFSSVANVFLKKSIAAKEKVMISDKYEKKNAIILEYGHTVGHAIEMVDAKIKKNGNSISHGEAVGLGMLVAAQVSNQIGFLSEENLNLHFQLLLKFGCRTRLPQGVTVDAIIDLLFKDNKRGYLSAHKNEIPMILLKNLGEPVLESSYPLTCIPIPIVRHVLEKMLYKSSEFIHAIDS